eukprot:TRINITY_DN4193_c0_g2_i1.p1 TRINITY_DN4193_c0_g2~~TRINITY_DN4193_c0_g2_i1.p1  ORF type:complete len:412 (-),score=89.42 TRINITY_DN4193_c0_g2_i1:53-1288(-)
MGNSTAKYEYIDFGQFGVKGRRETMEDATAEILDYGDQPSQAFFGVFDGHFGSRCAIYLKDHLPNTLLIHKTFKTDIKLALKESFAQIDERFLSEAKSASPMVCDGSTCIVVIIRDKKLYVANVGDSRGVLCRDGKAIALSFDHKPDVPKEHERIKNNGGTLLMGRVQGRLAVARAFGDIEFKDQETLGPKWITAEPDILEFDVDEKTEFFILACDGLWEKLSNDEAVRFVRKLLTENKEDVKSVVKKLVQYALDLGSNDNISAIIVVLKPKKFKRRKRTNYGSHLSVENSSVDSSSSFNELDIPTIAIDEPGSNSPRLEKKVEIAKTKSPLRERPAEGARRIKNKLLGRQKTKERSERTLRKNASAKEKNSKKSIDVQTKQQQDIFDRPSLKRRHTDDSLSLSRNNSSLS